MDPLDKDSDIRYDAPLRTGYNMLTGTALRAPTRPITSRATLTTHVRLPRAMRRKSLLVPAIHECLHGALLVPHAAVFPTEVLLAPIVCTLLTNCRAPEVSEGETAPPNDDRGTEDRRIDWRQPVRLPETAPYEDVNHWTHPDYPRRGEYAQGAERMRSVKKTLDNMDEERRVEAEEQQKARRKIIADLDASIEMVKGMIAKKKAAKEKRLAEEKAKADEEERVAQDQRRAKGACEQTDANQDQNADMGGEDNLQPLPDALSDDFGSFSLAEEQTDGSV